MAIYAAEDSKTFRFNYRYRMSTNKIRKSKIDNISLLIYASCSDFDKEKNNYAIKNLWSIKNLPIVLRALYEFEKKILINKAEQAYL